MPKTGTDVKNGPLTLLKSAQVRLCIDVKAIILDKFSKRCYLSPNRNDQWFLFIAFPFDCCDLIHSIGHDEKVSCSKKFGQTPKTSHFFNRTLWYLDISNQHVSGSFTYISFISTETRVEIFLGKRSFVVRWMCSNKFSRNDLNY